MVELSDASYVLGHSEFELNRLEAQARLIDPITRRFLLEAGIKPGMRVLDVGSGAGDVAFLAASLVDLTGEVIGVDRSTRSIEAARARAKSRSIGNVSFFEGDPAQITNGHFDAIIGRYVLMFQSNPSEMLRGLATLLRPGGLIVFHESDYDGLRSIPKASLYDLCCRWIVAALHDTDVNMGLRLGNTFTFAGLPNPTMRLEAFVGTGKASFPYLDLTAGLVRTLLPELERLNVATAAYIDIATLLQRLKNDVAANDSVVVGRYEVGAWCSL